MHIKTIDWTLTRTHSNDTQKQGETKRHKETQRDTKRHKKDTKKHKKYTKKHKKYTKRQKETQRDTKRNKETQTQTNTNKEWASTRTQNTRTWWATAFCAAKKHFRRLPGPIHFSILTCAIPSGRNLFSIDSPVAEKVVRWSGRGSVTPKEKG